MNFIQSHWMEILLIGGAVWAAAVNALPAPLPGGNAYYAWFYAFAHALKLNLGESVSAARIAKEK